MEIARRYPKALHTTPYKRVTENFPTRTAFADTNLLWEMNRQCVRVAGAVATFALHADSFCGQSYPVLNLLISAPSPEAFVKRVQLVETSATVATKMAFRTANSIRVEQQRLRPATMATLESGIAYWGVLLGVMRAAGYRNLELTPIDAERPLLFYHHDRPNPELVEKLPLLRVAQISWTHVEPASPWTLPPVKTLGETYFVARIIRSIRAAIDEHCSAPRLDRIANSSCESTRSVQRRLASAWTTVRDIHSAVRLQRASRLLIEHSDPLSEVACGAGYADAPHLVREFRRLVRVTPERYRSLALF